MLFDNILIFVFNIHSIEAWSKLREDLMGLVASVRTKENSGETDVKSLSYYKARVIRIQLAAHEIDATINGYNWLYSVGEEISLVKNDSFFEKKLFSLRTGEFLAQLSHINQV